MSPNSESDVVFLNSMFSWCRRRTLQQSIEKVQLLHSGFHGKSSFAYREVPGRVFRFDLQGTERREFDVRTRTDAQLKFEFEEESWK